MEKSIITHSELQTGKTCLRQMYFRYQLGLRPIQDALPLRLGKAIHYGLHLRKLTMMGTPLKHNTILDQVLAEYDKNKPNVESYSWEIERVTIAAMLNCYCWRWAEQDKQIKYVASELTFSIPIVNPDSNKISRTFNVAGVIDGIATLPDGRLAIVEHKTSGQDVGIESDYWKQLRIDSQISLYFMAAKRLGYDVETIIYDVLRKPTIRPYHATPTDKRKYKADGSLYANMHDKDEAPDDYGLRFVADIGERPDFYYSRREIPRLDADIEEFRHELWQNAKMLQECKKYNRWYRNTRACIGFGRCPYFNLCTTGYDIQSGVVPDNFEMVTNVHTELGE